MLYKIIYFSYIHTYIHSSIKSNNIHINKYINMSLFYLGVSSFTININSFGSNSSKSNYYYSHNNNNFFNFFYLFWYVSFLFSSLHPNISDSIYRFPSHALSRCFILYKMNLSSSSQVFTYGWILLNSSEYHLPLIFTNYPTHRYLFLNLCNAAAYYSISW